MRKMKNWGVGPPGAYSNEIDHFNKKSKVWLAPGWPARPAQPSQPGQARQARPGQAEATVRKLMILLSKWHPIPCLDWKK